MFIKYGAPLAHGDGERRNQGEASTWYPSIREKETREESTVYPRIDEDALHTLYFHIILQDLTYKAIMHSFRLFL